MSIAVLNTDAGLSATTLLNAESAQNVTGLKTFGRSPNPPFAVQSGSANVTNLDADLVDGVHMGAPTTNRIPYASSATALTFNSGFTFDGTTFTTPGQIAFPATQAPSSGANVLDDYEEGAWTPVIGGSGGTSGQVYSVQVGSYIKIGKFVHIQAYVVLSTKGTITTNLQIQGLPFAALTLTNSFTNFSLQWFSTVTSYVNVFAETASATSALNIYGLAAAGTTGTASQLATADIGNSTGFIFSGAYIANA